MPYYVYVLERGWWAISGVYSSDPKQAKPFIRMDAIAFCRKRYSPLSEGQVTAVPVLASDVHEIIGE